MKKIISMVVALLCWTTTMSFAQNVMDLKSVPLHLKEDYLISLFDEYTLIYCDYDVLEKDMYIKKMEVFFHDSTFFFSAFFMSSTFSLYEYDTGTYECIFITIDDGGNGLDLDEEGFKELPRFKAILDAILRNTPFQPYMGE